MDTAYGSLGLPFGPALSVVGTVVAVKSGYAVADVGLKALGMDHGNPSIPAPRSGSAATSTSRSTCLMRPAKALERPPCRNRTPPQNDATQPPPTRPAKALEPLPNAAGEGAGAPAVPTPASSAGLVVGDRVHVLPAHVDPTMALHEVAWVVRGEEVVDRWAIDLRGWG